MSLLPARKQTGNTYRRIQITDNASSHLGDTFITYPTPKPIHYNSNFSYTIRRPERSYFPRPTIEQALQNGLRPIDRDILPQPEFRKLDPSISILTGAQNVGKTQLALRYLHTHRACYTATFFIDASCPETLARDFKALFRTLFSFFTRPGTFRDSRDVATSVIEIDKEPAVLGVKYWFQALTEQEKLKGSAEKRRYLLIFDGVCNVSDKGEEDENDNANDEGFDLGFYIPDAPNLDVIITTRCIEYLGAVAGLGEEISVPCRDDWLYD